MRRTILTLVASTVTLVALASPAVAGSRVVHFSFELTADEWSVDPAGTLCNFDLKGWAVGSVTVTEIADDPGLYIVVLRYTGYHENLSTGYTLSDRDSFAVIGIPLVSANGTRELNVGLQWNLRDEDGNIVALEAGQVRLDFATEPPTWTYTGLITANTYDIAGTAELVCPALRGAPDYPGM